MSGAFHGDPALKAQALASLGRADAPADIGPIEAWAETFGLPAAIALLPARLAQGAGVAMFRHKLLAAIRPGFDLRPVPHRWAIWLWRDAATPLRAAIPDPASLDLVEKMMALHEREVAGKRVERHEWRTARNALAPLSEGETDAAAAVGVVAAGCWDYRNVPGAVEDMAVARVGVVITATRRALIATGWRREDDEEANRIAREQAALVEQEVGPSAEGEEAMAYRMRLGVAIRARIDSLNHPLLKRWAENSAATSQAVEFIQAQARAGLMGLVTPEPSYPGCVARTDA